MEKNKPLSNRSISLLMNSGHFLLQHAFIVDEKNRYRVIFIKQEKRIVDKSFKSVRGARIFFSKKNSRLFRKYKKFNMKPEWTPFYQPEAEWLEKIYRLPLHTG